jgi:hypothetical protein
VDELCENLSKENPEAFKRCKTTSLSDMAANGTDLASLPEVGHIFRAERRSESSADGVSDVCSASCDDLASQARAPPSLLDCGPAFGPRRPGSRIASRPPPL